MDSQLIEEYLRTQEKLKEKAKECNRYVHGFMIYKCEQCGAVYIMWLEKGLEDKKEDKLTGNHKPVPFCITCPRCYGITKHICFYIGQNEFNGEYRLLEKGANFFLNDPGVDRGIPIIFKEDFLPKDIEQLYKLLCENHYINDTVEETISLYKEFSENNRQNRRHPEHYYENKYKRHKKGQKFFN